MTKQPYISRRVFLKAALGSAIAAGLTGCGGALGSSAAGSGSSTAASAGLPAPEDCPFSGYEGDDGRYALLTNPYTGNSFLLYWFDYGTMRQTVVCGAPNCAHLDESCSAALTGCWADPFRYSEGLLWIANTADNSDELWRMNLDGTGHTRVYTAPANSYIVFVLAACAQGAWVLLSYTDSTEPYESHEELHYVDFAGGQAQALASFTGSRIWPGGAYNGLLLLNEITETGGSLNAYDPSTGALVRRLLSAGAFTRVDGMLYQAYSDGTMIGWPIDGEPDAPTVRCLLQLPEGMQPHTIEIKDMVEGHALVSIADEGEAVKGGPLWAADLATGQLTALPTTYTDKGLNCQPEILAVTPAGLFGWARTAPTTVTHVFADGTVETMEDRDVLWCLLDRKAAAMGEWKFEEFAPVG